VPVKETGAGSGIRKFAGKSAFACGDALNFTGSLPVAVAVSSVLRQPACQRMQKPYNGSIQRERRRFVRFQSFNNVNRFYNEKKIVSQGLHPISVRFACSAGYYSRYHRDSVVAKY